MAVALAPTIDVRQYESPVADPLGFLAGKRYTCFCGRSVVGSILCRDCADEMTDYYRAVARRRLAVSPPPG
jgi:hypothetical protein